MCVIATSPAGLACAAALLIGLNSNEPMNSTQAVILFIASAGLLFQVFGIAYLLRHAGRILRSHCEFANTAERKLSGAKHDLDVISTQLNSAAEQLDAIGRLAKVGCWSVDLRAQTVNWSEQTYRLHEVPLNQTISLDKAIDFYAAHAREELSDTLSKSLETLEPFTLDSVLALPSGREVNVRIIGNPVAVDGEAIGLEGAIQDITDYQRLSNAASESQERQMLHAECAELGTWDWDVVNDHVQYNALWCNMLGYDPGELAADSSAWEQRIHPEDASFVRQQLEAHFKHGTPFALDHRLRHRNGEWIWIHTAGKVYKRDSIGKPLRMAGVHLNVTERYDFEARAKLHAQENELIVNTLANAIVFTDASMRITGWNRQSEELLGYTFAECRQQPLFQTIFRADRVPKSISFDVPQEAIATSKSGREIPIEFKITSIGLGADRAFLFILTDLAKRRELLQAQKLESIGVLAAGIAHEINTPMQFVCDNVDYLDRSTNRLLKLAQQTTLTLETGHTVELEDFRQWWNEQLEIIKFPKLQKNVPEAFEDAEVGIGRVIQIVRAMKEISHPGQAEKELVDINHCVENTITICWHQIKYVADVETDFSDDLPGISSHSAELSQVIMNLVVNAGDAIRDRYGREKCGLIKIRTAPHKGGTLIQVSDNGAGIPDHVKQRIFDPFFTTKAAGEGTGQGLTMCYNILKQNGGSIDVHSAIGQGTTFSMWLPAPEKPEAKGVEETPSFCPVIRAAATTATTTAPPLSI